MKAKTENYIIAEFERKQNIKHQQRRLFSDSKIIESLSLGLQIQKPKILEILTKHKLKFVLN